MGMRGVRVGLVGLLVGLAGVTWLAPVASATADGCEEGVESDFNGDGRSDTVVADPWATVRSRDPSREDPHPVRRRRRPDRGGQPRRVVAGRGERGRGRPRPNDRFGFALGGRGHRLRHLHRRRGGHSVRGHQRPSRFRLRPGDLGRRCRARNRRGLAAVHPGETSATPSQPATSSATRSTRSRTSDRAVPGRRTPTRWPSVLPGGEIAGHNDAGWVGFRVAYDGGNVASRSPRTHRRAGRRRGRRPVRVGRVDRPFLHRAASAGDRRARRHAERGRRRRRGRRCGDGGDRHLLRRRVRRQRQPTTRTRRRTGIGRGRRHVRAHARHRSGRRHADWRSASRARTSARPPTRARSSCSPPT